jgi:hypothetical protein
VSKNPNYYCFNFGYIFLDNTQYIIRGQSTSLTCPIDDRNCGELHSIKWFRGQTRIGVASGDKEVRRIEDEFSDR